MYLNYLYLSKNKIENSLKNLNFLIFFPALKNDIKIYFQSNFNQDFVF